MSEYAILYLMGVNTVAAIIFLLDFILYAKRGTETIPTPVLLTICLLGGTLGAIIIFAIFDRKLDKHNLTWRIIYTAILIFQILIILVIYGPHSDGIRNSAFAIWEQNRLLIIYLVLINIVTFVIFGIDKWKAIHNKWRIKITTLLGLCIIGGSIGGFVGMKAFHHKTQKSYFSIGVPLIITVQLALLIYLKLSRIL